MNTGGLTGAEECSHVYKLTHTGQQLGQPANSKCSEDTKHQS